MSALCSQASCGWCGRCTAAWEREDIELPDDSEYFAFLVDVTKQEQARLQAEADDEQEPPF